MGPHGLAAIRTGSCPTRIPRCWCGFWRAKALAARGLGICRGPFTAIRRPPIGISTRRWRHTGPSCTPTPIVRPDWPHWERTLQEAVDRGARAIRIYPGLWGLGPRHPALTELAEGCARAGVVVHVTMRFEDLRQRHQIDGGSDVLAATIRGLVRREGASPRPVVLVAGAGREVIEEIHWGLTPEEQGRAFYDFHWVWGPPEDHFAHLVRTLGPDRLALSSWWPLRLTQQSRALIDLLPAAADDTATEKAAMLPPAFAAFADGRRMEARAAAVAHSIT